MAATWSSSFRTKFEEESGESEGEDEEEQEPAPEEFPALVEGWACNPSEARFPIEAGVQIVCTGSCSQWWRMSCGKDEVDEHEVSRTGQALVCCYCPAATQRVSVPVERCIETVPLHYRGMPTPFPPPVTILLPATQSSGKRLESFCAAGGASGADAGAGSSSARDPSVSCGSGAGSSSWD